MRRPFCRLLVVLRTAFLCAALAAGAAGIAPSARAQQSDDATTVAVPVDNSAEYALDPSYREPSTSSRVLAGAAVVTGAFVVGVVAAGTAVGGLVAAGAAAWFYATMP